MRRRDIKAPEGNRVLVFASGSKDGGGSGFEAMVTSPYGLNVVAVVSNHENGGVRQRADRLGVPFIFFDGPFTEEGYKSILEKVGEVDLIFLSGWLKLAKGLDPTKTLNIHPGPLPRFGGRGMYGHHVHEAVMEAYRKFEIATSEVNIHFVTDEYDRGPVVFKKQVSIYPFYTVDMLATEVNKVEHQFQSEVAAAFLMGKISWSGKMEDSPTTFPNYLGVAPM